MSSASFLRVFAPFVLTLLCGRLILQTDLLMISRLGESCIAAFGVPMRVMLLDMIAAFAIAPVVSVLIASARDESDQRTQVTRSLQLTALLGVALTAAGLVLYPRITSWVLPAGEIRELGGKAVFWLTLAIPSRMTQFAGSMSLHGLKRGRQAVLITVFELGLNFALDWLLIFRFGLGFSGAYLGTLFCSWFSLGVTIFLLRKEINGKLLLSFDLRWARVFLSKSASEVGRLASERVAALALLAIFSWSSSSAENPAARLGSFSVASEILFLATIPCIAAMRSVGIVLAPESDQPVFKLYRALRSTAIVGFAVSVALALAIFAAGPFAGTVLYHLDPQAMRWWLPFVAILSLFLPVRWLTSLQRGAWQAKRDFKTLALLDVATQWSLVIPFAAFGVNQDSPWMAWSGLLVGELVSLVVLWMRRERVGNFISGFEPESL